MYDKDSVLGFNLVSLKIEIVRFCGVKNMSASIGY